VDKQRSVMKMKRTWIVFLILLPVFFQGCSESNSEESIDQLSRKLQDDRIELLEVAKAMPFNEPGSLDEARSELDRIRGLRTFRSDQLSEQEISSVQLLENYIKAIESGRTKARALRNRIELTEQKLLELTGTIPKSSPNKPTMPIRSRDESKDPFK
jgi:hypothetical protein